MPDAFGVALLGFLLGLRHATDADHVVAVTTIVAHEPVLARAARIGALWGVGHSLTILLVGGALIVFRVAVPPRVATALELGVAAMLVILGLLTLRAAGRTSPAGTPDPGRSWRPVLVGTVHGLAGSAAVALLVLATIRDPAWAVAYLAVFGLGTIGGMTLVTALLAVPAALAGARVLRLRRGIQLAAGVLSVVVGLTLARTLLRADGLAAAAPVRGAPVTGAPAPAR